MNGQTKAMWWAIGLMGTLFVFMLGLGAAHSNIAAHPGAQAMIDAQNANVLALRADIRELRAEIRGLRAEIRSMGP
jgi:hypothetical protein